jgi:ribosomal protein L11 methyltransferase
MSEWTYKIEIACDRPDELADVLIRTGFAEGAQVVDEATAGPDESPERGVVTYIRRPRPDAELDITSELEDLDDQAPGIDWTVGTVERFDDTSWKTRWKEFFEVVEISDRVAVGPPWEDVESAGREVSLVLNPGMAFGVGTHETTRLACQLLDRCLADTTSPSLLDVGCGTAVLAMAAARLGASPVDGLDIDEDALASARSNLEANDLVEQVQLASTPLREVSGTYDIVVANILWPTLLELRDALLAHVQPSGTLILSGIQVEHIEDFEGAFVRPGWTVSDRLTEGEWTALTVEPDRSR